MSAAYQLDVSALYGALDTVRRHRGMTWQDIAGETGLQKSLFTRLAEGRRPDADGLVTLLVWLGRRDALGRYVTAEPAGGGGCHG